jgi:hypothetical protein
MGVFERAELIDEVGQLEGVEDELAVSGVDVQALSEVELDFAGQRVAVAAGVEVGELVPVDVELEFKVAGGELHFDHARHRSGRPGPVAGQNCLARGVGELVHVGLPGFLCAPAGSGRR